MEEAWCRRNVECALNRSPRSKIAGLTSRDEYSVTSWCSAARILPAGAFGALGSIVRLID